MLSNKTHDKGWLPACAVLLAVLFAPVAHGQQQVDPDLHWAYASFFGTGWYRVSDAAEAFVVRTSPRWTVGEAGFSDQGKRRFAYTFRVPVTLGLTRFDLDDIPSIIDLDNLSTLSVGFGADMDIPVSNRFSLRPIAEVGYGGVIGDSDRAWIWRAGLRGRYGFEAGKLDWALLARVGITGIAPNDGESDDFSFTSLAAEFAYPVSWWSSKDDQTMLYWNLGYTSFIEDIEFSAGPLGVDSVANYLQIGMALGRKDRPIKIWFLKFDRLGLAYKYSDTGRLRGIEILFRSLYDL